MGVALTSHLALVLRIKEGYSYTCTILCSIMIRCRVKFTVRLNYSVSNAACIASNGFEI
jgi:hypothetical protein